MSFVVRPLSDPGVARALCDSILATLPDWFGPRDIYQDYLEDVQDRPAFAASLDGSDQGIMALTQTSAAAVDIHLMAVAPAAHGKGLGHAMVGEAQTFARDRGAAFLTVKTLGPSRDNAAYALTRAFYRRQGFEPVEEFIDFWGEGYPMLLLCQSTR
ncbi:GNAT family N-acetyltransferase [Yoonia sp. R2331]|uniref:GNAT family N-acetyltransferase n=1 Tax=Yoonia sp. R2331 TaxID=3237238 RepID=UPI0034E4B76E